MIGGKSVLALIPARGGSKGIPHKNIVSLGGKPLLAHSIDAVANHPLIDRVVVSTDDLGLRETVGRFSRSWMETSWSEERIVNRLLNFYGEVL
jgi:CMP-2-keto-3-deoxyoctulosonic acid synthetase